MLELHFLNCTMTLEHKDTLSQEHRHRTYTYGMELKNSLNREIVIEVLYWLLEWIYPNILICSETCSFADHN